MSFDEAVDAAAAILRQARAPLVYGLGQTSCEAQRRAVALAEAVGAVIDLAAPAAVRLPGDRLEHGDVRGDPRPRRARRRLAADPADTRACWSGCVSTALAVVVDVALSVPPQPRRPASSSSSTRRDFEALWALRARSATRR